MYNVAIMISGGSMFIKKIKQKNGTHYLQLTEGYRVDGKVKHRAIKNFGVLETLEKDNPNILAELKEKYRDETIQKHEKYNKKISLKDVKRYEEKNYGYFILEAVYENLGIPEFLLKIQQSKKIKYDLNKIMKLHIFGRTLIPDSKLGIFEKRDYFYEDMSQIGLNSIYRSLDLFNEIKEDLQLVIHNNIAAKYGRDCTLVFYDVTNYYFEIHENDRDIVDEETKDVKEGFRKKGCSKKHMPQPLVAMGLIIDKNNIPVAYQLFRGNTPDTKTLIPMIGKISKKYDTGRIIVVADKGLNSENNLNYLVDENTEDDMTKIGNGYILSQTIRGASDEFKKTAIDQEGYVENKEKKYKKKSIIRDRVLHHFENGKKVKGTGIKVKEKVVFFWSENYAKRRQYKREEEKSKIKYFIKNQDVLPKLEKGLKSYIKEVVVDENDKEIKNVKVKYVFDEEKFNESSKYDGYYAIITSETELTDEEIIEKYRGLSEIENCFRILQSDLEGRPINVRTESRIEGHFLTCFISLTIMRVLQNLTRRKYTVENLIEGINSANLHNLAKTFLEFSKTNKVYQDIEAMFKIDSQFDTLEIEKFAGYKKEIMYNIKNADFN